jgi:hypothetical protein
MPLFCILDDVCGQFFVDFTAIGLRLSKASSEEGNPIRSAQVYAGKAVIFREDVGPGDMRAG